MGYIFEKGSEVDVIGSPGAASEEVVTQQLSGDASYQLTWAEAHQDFRVKMYLYHEGDNTRAPSVGRLELVG